MSNASALSKRSFIGMLAGLPLAACVSGSASAMGERRKMYGLIGKMIAVEGERDRLAQILLSGLSAMPGNLSYIVANDPADPDALWITEVWSDEAAHAASLALPSVQDAIRQGRPLIAGMERIAETEPLGGTGLAEGAGPVG